jgi:glycosyltransferase involved in cell wall biosynthesis
MDWMPNIDGVAWFLREVWSGLKQAVPGVRFLVIGRNPPAALRHLAANDAAVSFTGTVADVRPYLAKCHATVVPLLAGGGTRLKILEVMAAGVPVVSTTVGAEGLPLVADRHLLIADTAERFGAQTAVLLKDRAMADRLVEAARTEVVESHSWDRCSRIFLDLCLKAGAAPSSTSSARHLEEAQSSRP